MYSSQVALMWIYVKLPSLMLHSIYYRDTITSRSKGTMGPGVGSTIACKMKKLPPPATRPTNYTVREQKLQILEVINCPLDLPEFTQVMGRLVHVPRPVCNMAAGHIVHLYHRIIT